MSNKHQPTLYACAEKHVEVEKGKGMNEVSQMNESVTLDVGYKRDLKKDEMKIKEIRNNNDRKNFYMTTQQPQPAFFSFGDSCSAVTTGGLHFGVALPWVGSCTLGMGLYPETLLRRFSGSCGAASGQVLPSVSVFGGGCGG